MYGDHEVLTCLHARKDFFRRNQNAKKGSLLSLLRSLDLRVMLQFSWRGKSSVRNGVGPLPSKIHEANLKGYVEYYVPTEGFDLLMFWEAR